MSYITTVEDLIYNLSSKDNLQYKDIKLSIQNYLHYIYSVNDNSLINDSFKNEPKHHSNIPQSIYAYLAGVVEKVSQELKLSIPNWVYNSYYYLESDWFPPEVEKLDFLKEMLKISSPEPFKSRKIYVSENAISVC